MSNTNNQLRKKLFVETLEHRDVPATLFANSGNNDGAPSDDFLDIEEAVFLVNNGGNAIATFGRSLSAAEALQIDTSEPFGVNDRIIFTAENSTVTMGGDPLNFTRSVSFESQPGRQTTFVGNNVNRVIQVTNNANVKISDVVVTNGRSVAGAGIDVTNATLTLIRSTVSGNTLNSGVSFIGTTGAGIRAFQSNLTIIDSTISNNTSNQAGGGISSIYRGTLNVIRSTISGNSGTLGSGIYLRENGGTVTASITDSTIVNNPGTHGIFANQLNNSTSSLMRVNLNNNIIVGHTEDVRVASAVTQLDGSFNLLGNIVGGQTNFDSGVNNQLGVNFAGARLGPLTANGGPTATHALLAGSPAIDTGNTAFNPPDQRGLPTFNSRRDRGAFEAQALFNAPPVLAGVPLSRTTNEGTAVAFTATATDADSTTLTFSLVDAPTGATINATTGAFNWVPAENQDGVFTFAVRASDGTNTDTDLITVHVTEVNQAPTLSNVLANATAVPGSTIQFTATAADNDLVNGVGNGRTFSLVNAPTGASIDPDTGVFTWTPNEFNPIGTHVFKVRVTDDGIPTRSATQNVTINLVRTAVLNGTLFVGGTGASDVLAVNPNTDLTQLIVTSGKVRLGTFAAGNVNRIEMHGLSGNDTLSVSPKITKNAFLFGESGADKLTGGGGSDVLVGGDDNDVIAGGGGLNVLIGGGGSDKLTGGSNDDLLIASATIFDANVASLLSINAEWSSGGLFNTRVANLTNGAGLANGVALSNVSISDDLARDTLTGGLGTDWFITNLGDLLSPLPVVGEVTTI